jgi:hypothetical protein
MMTRVLIACLLAAMLVQPTAAGTGSSGVDRRSLHPTLPFAIDPGVVNDAMALFAGEHIPTRLARIAVRSFWSNVAPLRNARDNLSQCSQALAFGPDVMCVHACDASKEACEGKCSAGRAGCMAQCPGIGFACDYYCQAAFYVCRGTCARQREACVGNCPATGGER